MQRSADHRILITMSVLFDSAATTEGPRQRAHTLWHAPHHSIPGKNQQPVPQFTMKMYGSEKLCAGLAGITRKETAYQV